MKAVMLSIQPKWCELIASGEKTIEVRKTAPKIDTPFKCYIYQTKRKWIYRLLKKLGLNKGKVIGEFVCDRIEKLRYNCDGYGHEWHEWNDEYVDYANMCLSEKELEDYLGTGNGYAWHISDLKIYDRSKELGEFFGYGECEPDPIKCHACKYMEHGNSWAGIEADCNAFYDGLKQLNRPPQSWCYVEEIS